ncbi:MAG: queuine tRNA-ribosyltransferase family protein [Candidatus Dojkabacteria bacterium]|nr:queuine tRNA-ribosyltransferase family protein [Candidatus Dojkabacteria bacterium]
MYKTEIDLPAFMPDATYGAIKTLSFNDLNNIGIHGVVTNTLHIEQTIGSENIKKIGGIHKFFNWNKFIVTDSGGWQVFSLINAKEDTKHIVTEVGCSFLNTKNGKHCFLSPETSIMIQHNLQPNAMIVLDFPIHGNATYSERKQSVKITTQWAKRSLKKFKEIYSNNNNRPILGAVIQGGNDFELRTISATELLELDLQMYNFGGTPMYFGETWKTTKEYRIFHEMLVYVSSLIPNDKIKYAMGVGQPIDIAFCIDYGWDLFDTVLPTRNARHGYLYTSLGTTDETRIYKPQNLLKNILSEDELSYSIMHIKTQRYIHDSEPVDANCKCECCTTVSRSYLRHLLKIREPSGYRLATIHNLTFYENYVRKIRTKLRQNKKINFHNHLKLK